MTHTPETLAALLAGTTEGPWYAMQAICERWHGEGERVTSPIDFGYIPQICKTYMRPKGSDADECRIAGMANVRLAASAPTLATELSAALVREAAKDAEIAKLREALEWYASPANWCDSPDWEGPDTSTPNAVPFRIEEELGPMVCDCGDTARAALAKEERG